MSWLRENWRVSFLVVLLLASSVALFAPGIGASGTNADGESVDRPTNLNYGLELSGGVRLRASVVGVTAENVTVTEDNERAIEQEVAAALSLDNSSVRARPLQDVVEVYSNNSVAEVRTALTELGYQPRQVRQGVTEATRDTIVSTISSKVDQTGFSGASVYDVNPRGGRRAVHRRRGAGPQRLPGPAAHRGPRRGRDVGVLPAERQPDERDGAR